MNAEEVHAEVVEPANLAKVPEPAIAYTLPTAKIGNLDAIEQFVANVERFFGGVEINPADKEQVKQLRGLRADINKAANAINDKRKAMDKDVKAALQEADGALNDLRDRLKSVYDKTGEQIAEADRLWADARRSLLQGEYESVAPALVELITLDAFIAAEPKLMQKQWGGNKACNALDDMVVQAVRDREEIAGAGLAHHVEADAAYCRTLDVRAALAEDKRLRDAEAAAAAHAEAARALREKVSAPDAAPQPNPAPQQRESAPQPQSEPLCRYSFSFVGTESQAEQVKRLMVSLGVSERKMARLAV